MSTTVRLEPTQPGADAPETAPLAAAHTQVLSDAQIAAATSRLETQPLAASTPLLLPLERIAVGLLLLVALVTRMYTLSVTELNIDELGQVYAAQLDFRPALRDIATHEGAAPLDYFLTAAMLTVGRDEGTLRMPAAVMGVLTILVLYLLSRSMFGRAEALVIASILTILPLHVRYSQELRFYSLGVLGVVSAAAVFWYAQKRAKWWAWALYGLTLIVFLHAHYYVAFTAAALALWTLFFRRSQLLACWSFSLLALLAFLPWVYYDNVTVQTRGGIDLLIENWSLPAGATAIWTGPFALSLVAPKWNLAGLEFGWGVGWVLRYVYAFWALIGLSLLWLWFSRRRDALTLPLLVMVIMIAGLILLNTIGHYRLYTRQYLLPAPFLLMAAVAVLFELISRLPGSRIIRPVAATAVILVSVLMLWPSVQNIYTSKNRVSTLRNVAAFLHQNIDHDHTVVLAGPAERAVYYFPDISRQIRGAYRTDVVSFIETAAKQQPVVWLVPWYGSTVNGMLRWARENGAWEVTPWNGNPSIFVYSASNPEESMRIALESARTPTLTDSGRARLARRLANQLAERGRIEEAQPMIDLALRHEGASADINSIPDYVSMETLQALGRANVDAGTPENTAKAAAIYRLILERDPGDFVANFFFAQQAGEQGNWEQAVNTLQQLAAVQGITQVRLANVRRLLLQGYYELGNMDAVCSLWIDVQRAVATNERWHRQMAAQMSDWFEQHASCEAQLLAESLRNQGAAASLDAIPEDAPTDLLIFLAQANLAEGNAEHAAKAEELYRRVLARDPLEFTANYYFARKAAQAGDWGEAAEIMEGALTVKGLTNIRLANGRQLLLLAYHELGRTEDACKLWDVVQKLVGQNERRHTEMAESMADWARENLTCASGSGARASGSP